jgi:hypothetical protein
MDVYRMAARRGTPTRRRALGTQVVTQSVRAVPPANHNATRLVPSGEPSMRSCVLNHAQRRAVGWGPPHSSERGLLAGPWRHIDVDRSRKSSEEMYDSFTLLHARAEPETTDVNATLQTERNEITITCTISIRYTAVSPALSRRLRGQIDHPRTTHQHHIHDLRLTL